jgi:hypothetical protein
MALKAVFMVLAWDGFTASRRREALVCRKRSSPGPAQAFSPYILAWKKTAYVATISESRPSASLIIIAAALLLEYATSICALLLIEVGASHLKLPGLFCSRRNITTWNFSPPKGHNVTA